MTCCRQSAETHTRSDRESDPAGPTVRAGNGGHEQTPPVMDIMAVAEQSGQWGGERRDIDPLHSCRAAPSMRAGRRHVSAPGAEAEATYVKQHVQHVTGACVDQHVGMT